MTARARILAVFGAYLCLTAHLTGVVHVLVVRHATCPGHGEVIHGDEPVASESPAPSGDAFRDASREPAEEADEHCLLMATRRRDMAMLAPGQLPFLHAPEASVLEVLPTDAAAPSRALLRFAPKTSPPAVA